MAPVKVQNKVNQLTWSVPIVNANGTPTDEFMRKWLQQATQNASMVDLTTAISVSKVLDLISSVIGAVMVRGTTQWTGLVPVSDGRVLRDKGVGAVPIWDTISDVLDVIGNTRGSLLYRGAAGWAILAPSATGKVLTDGGAGADPSWQASAGGSGGGAASIQDDGTTVYLAISDSDGQLVLDGAGDPVFMPEAFPPSALPLASAAAFGAVKVDNLTIAAAAGIISSKFDGLSLSLAALGGQTFTTGSTTVIKFDTAIVDTQGAYSVSTGKYTPTEAGKYFVVTSVTDEDNAGAGSFNFCFVDIRKNGTRVAEAAAGVLSPAGGIGYSSTTMTVSALVSMNGTTDFIDIFLNTDSITAGSGTSRIAGNNICTAVIIKLGA